MPVALAASQPTLFNGTMNSRVPSTPSRHQYVSTASSEQPVRPTPSPPRVRAPAARSRRRDGGRSQDSPHHARGGTATEADLSSARRGCIAIKVWGDAHHCNTGSRARPIRRAAGRAVADAARPRCHSQTRARRPHLGHAVGQQRRASAANAPSCKSARGTIVRDARASYGNTPMTRWR